MENDKKEEKNLDNIKSKENENAYIKNDIKRLTLNENILDPLSANSKNTNYKNSDYLTFNLMDYYYF